MTGKPRPLPTGWDQTWQGALEDWMGVANLEERLAAPGWIDPRCWRCFGQRPEPRSVTKSR